MPENSRTLTFSENRLLPELFGEQDKHLQCLERRLGITVFARGNVVSLFGAAKAIAAGERILLMLYRQLEQGKHIDMPDLDALIRMVVPELEHRAKEEEIALFEDEIIIKTPRKYIKPYTAMQKAYIQALYTHELVFGNGPAGTGKTYLAVAVGVMMFLHRKVERLILSRPALEAGEKIGFLPGDMKEKVDPYMRPLYDALYDMMGAEKVSKLIENKDIEIAPLAFMRGRTLSHAYVILDEAQNTTPQQMKMFLTRLGEGSRMVVTGDLSQTDLPRGIDSGLQDAEMRLKHIPEIGFTYFSDQDIVRHPLTAKIVAAYGN